MIDIKQTFVPCEDFFKNFVAVKSTKEDFEEVINSTKVEGTWYKY